MEKLIIAGALAALFFINRHTRKVFFFILPLVLSGLAYEFQGSLRDLLQGHIWVKEPYLFELKWFGVNTEAGRVTLNNWCQQNLHPFFDLLFGSTYVLYILLFLIIAAYFNWVSTKKGTPLHSAEYMQKNAMKAMWAFFWVNAMGYALYYVYPMAPPWYVMIHGLGPAIPDAPPNPAGGARFDELVGMGIHASFYSKSLNIYAAMPSLHVAYPMVAVYYAFRFGALKMASIVYYLVLVGGAIYLNHHYLIDIIAGSALAILAAYMVDRFQNPIWEKLQKFIPQKG